MTRCRFPGLPSGDRRRETLDSRNLSNKRRVGVVKKGKRLPGLPRFSSCHNPHRRPSANPQPRRSRQLDALPPSRRQTDDRRRRCCFSVLPERLVQFHRLQHTFIMELRRRRHQGLLAGRDRIEDSCGGSVNDAALGWYRRHIISQFPLPSSAKRDCGIVSIPYFGSKFENLAIGRTLHNQIFR